MIRVAGSYLQTPSDGKFQIDSGNAITLGTSLGYTISKHFIVDFGYSHVFISKLNINIANTDSQINGATRGNMDTFVLKLTVQA